MDFRNLLVEDLSSVFEQVVNDPRDAALVTWYHFGREDDGVAFFNLEVLVFVRGHARESTHGLTLAACCDHHNFVIRQGLERVDPQPRVWWHLEIAKVECDLGVRNHALSVQDHLATVHHGY